MRTKLTISKAIKRAAPRFVLSFSFLMISVLLFAFFSFNNQALANVKPDMPTPGGTVMPDLFTGVMGYRIPIEVPPGRQGVQPGFALIYRSPSRNGWLGVGWDLEVGSIERRTKFGVDYDADDFVLRMSGATIDLINIGNDEYGARIEGGFYRIKKLSSTDGLFYWEVTDKIGMRYLYGQETEYRQHDPSDPTRIFKWCLDQVVDTSGNFMTFTYSKDLGQIYLDRIDYTGNGAIDPTNYVKFHLESRDDAPIMSTANFDVKTAYRLKTIELVANGNPVRAYKLQYDTDPNTPDPDYSVSTGRSVLMSVQQFGKDYALDGDNTVIAGSTLPAIELMHSAEENGLEEQEWTTTAPYWGASNLTYVGDFDGDGNDDIATVKIGACGIIGCMSTVWVKRSIGDSFIEERWADVTFGSYNYWVGDFNGDGKSDIAYTWTMKLYVLKSTGSSFVSESWTANAGNWGGTIAYVRIGDFNGDGKSDISTTSGGDGTIWVKRSTGYSFEEEVWTTTAPTWGASNRTFIGDFDGDGKDDIATVKLQLFCVLGCGYVPTFWVKHSNGSSFIEEKWSDGFPFPLLPYNGGTIMWFVGDFNGDGKTDIAVASGQTGFIIVRVARSTGAAFIIEDWMPTPGSYDSNWNASYAWAGDFNGDGKTDLATASGGTTWVWRSNGSKFSKEVWTTTASKWGGADYTWPGDFNGDGKTDIATASGGTIWVKQSKPFPVDLVTTAYNGLGGATEIAYVPSSHWENTSLPFSIQTVSAVTECDKYDRANKTCM
ncbi:MAG TPA: hypothetical protein DCO77_01240, partial [Nitrospiraceae bacterium]|nr:hypothetical protein [Nitrospiraceae bacterium]